MPNIKISDLAPIALPAVGDETFFEVQTVAAGEDVSRKISLDEIVSSTGLDASFLTVSANAQLPNERVLTEGANITFVDTGPNGTLTISATAAVVSFPLLAPDGSAAAPSYSFASDTDVGMFLVSAGILGLSVGGIEVTRAIEAAGDVSLIIDPGNTATAAAPALAFGDGDSGFRQPLDDNLQVVLAGVTRFFWELDSYNALAGTGPAMVNAAGGATVPGFVPRRSDPNTGIGSAGNDILSLIAGGVSIAQATSVGNNQFAIAQSGSSSVPELTSLADADTGFRWPANNQTVWIGGGSRAWNFSTAKFFSQFSNGPALLNEISSDTNPTVVADHADPDTGIGSSGNDEMSLIAGGVEAIRIDEVAGNVFITYFGPIIVPTGTAGAASIGFDGDPDTGYFSPFSDAFAITAGGIEAVTYFAQFGNIIQVNEREVGVTASTTQTQAGAFELDSSYSEIAIVANSGDAVRAFNVRQGQQFQVVNNGANDLQLFPAVGDDIGAGVDTAITIAAGDIGIFIGRDATNWDTLYNAAATPSGGGGIGGSIADNQVAVGAAVANDIEGTAGLTYDGAVLDITGNITLTGTVDGIDIATDVAANTAKVTNATHTGQVTGSGALALDISAITDQPASGAIVAGDTILINDGGVLSEATFTQMLAFFDANITITNSQVSDFDAGVSGNAAVTANTAKVTNATHTGQVTGATALSLAVVAITDQPAAGALIGADTFLVNDGGVLSEITADQMATFFGAGTANDVVQARRTTGFVLTTAFVDVTLDTTDVESDAAVLDHDLVTNTDNIIIGATGTYKVSYEVDIEVDTTGESTITADGRVRVNDGGVGLPGSDALCGAFSDGSIIADFMQNHLSQSFYVELTSGDFITLQLEKVEIGGTDTYTATRVLFTAERCL